MVLAVCPQRIVAQTNTFPLTGNAGVGTTSPGSRFVVKNTDGVSIGAGSTYSGIGFNRSVDDGAIFSSTRNAYQITNHDSYLGFDIWNGSGTSTFTDVLNISSGGKVGIGTSSPSGQLHVEASAATKILQSNLSSSVGTEVGRNFIYSRGVANNWGARIVASIPSGAPRVDMVDLGLYTTQGSAFTSSEKGTIKGS